MQQNHMSSTRNILPVLTLVQAIGWFVLAMLISAMNDTIMRVMGSSLPSLEIVWFRFLFGTLSLLPIMLYIGRSSFATGKPYIHFLRGTLFYISIAGWCIALNSEGVHLTLATMMSFTIPIFVLILARIFLKENVRLQSWLAALLGLLGIMISLEPGTEFNYMALVLLGSVVIFASLDVINKVLVVNESRLAMIFYSSLVTTIIGLVPALYLWDHPSIEELGYLAILGVGGNVVLYCILKAFSMAPVSLLSPFRYVELIFSSLFGIVVFAEFPETTTLLGCAIIIPATLYLGYSEAKRRD